MKTNLSKLTKSKFANTADFITDALRTAIWHGKLESSQPLRQDEIAAEFGTSKIPIREALFQLRAEGLVTSNFNRGHTVSELSSTEISEIYLMRIALEAVALKHAIPQFTKSDLVRAESIIDITEGESDPIKWVELDWEFHSTFYHAANMPLLFATIQSLYINVSRYIVYNFSKMDFQAKSQREHRLLLKACQARDIEMAIAYHSQQLQDAGERLISFVKEQEEQDKT